MPRISERHAQYGLLLLATAALGSCREPRPALATDTARRVAPDTSNLSASARSMPADSATVRPGGTTPRSPDSLPNVAPADSSMPKPSYATIPGWLVVNALHPLNDEDRAAPATDSVLTIFPFDSAWAHVSPRRPLTLLLPNGTTTTVFSNLKLSRHNTGNGSDVVFRSARPLAKAPFFAAWLLPAESAIAATTLPIRDSISADGNLRTWTAGPVRFVLRRLSKLSAKLTAEAAGVKPESLLVAEIRVDADTAMGFDSPAMLDLKEDWRLPTVGAAFRLGISGPIVIVYEAQGYECESYYILVFRQSRIERIDEPHYYSCGGER